jgi:hypothetical protein
VDWNTLGNILTARMVEEVLYGSYIDIKHRESRPNFTVDTDWKFSYEESGVVVLRKNNADSPIHSWMGRTVIDFPLEEIASFIADPDSAPLYDKYITESRTVHRISHSETHTDAIAYYKSEAKHCLVKAVRDFLLYVRYLHFDGKYIQTAMSVEHTACPPVPGVVRALINLGTGWHLEPFRGSQQRTLVTYLAHMDLVDIPAIIGNRVLKRQPLNILYVSKHLAQRQREIQRSLSLSPSTSEKEEKGEGEEGGGFEPTHFEDALPVRVFTHDSWRTRRTMSDPRHN